MREVVARRPWMAGGTGRRTKKCLQTEMLATSRPEGLEAHEKGIRCACLAPRSPVFWSRTHLRSSMESPFIGGGFAAVCR